MGRKNDPTWQQIADGVTSDASLMPSTRQIIQALAVKIREQDERIQELEQRIRDVDCRTALAGFGEQ